jgi:tetratricopeptide (TPR) repeat protein
MVAKPAAVIPDADVLADETALVAADARQLTITSAETYAQAGVVLRAIKALRAKVETACAPVVRATHAAHRAACTQRTQLEAPLVEAEGRLRRAMTSYLDAAERARRQAEAEAAAAVRRRDEDQALAEAAALEAAGQPEAAAEVLTEALTPMAPPVVVAAVPAVAGISARVVYRVVVDDLRVLVAAIVAGAVPLGAVVPHQPTLDAAARALREEFHWPGCRLVRESTLAVRAAEDA